MEVHPSTPLASATSCSRCGRRRSARRRCEVSSDTITAAPATSRVTVDARTPDAGVSTRPASTSTAVSWLPRSNLDVFWQGDVTEGRPLVRDELVVGALGSQILAPPIRDQTASTPDDRALPGVLRRPRSESRVLQPQPRPRRGGRRLTGSRPLRRHGRRQHQRRHPLLPGIPRVEIRDWQTCESTVNVQRRPERRSLGAATERVRSNASGDPRH